MSDNEYFKEQTKNALSLFGRTHSNNDFIKAFGEVKKAAMLSIQEATNRFDNDVFSSIMNAIDSIINGEYDDNFVLSFKQGGAGTSINMNFNEVIATLGESIYNKTFNKKTTIDPIEDINLYQSTNDTLPTAITIMTYRHLLDIEKQVIKLQEALITKENELGDILITGRTEMQTAIPITLGQVFGGWAGSIERDRWRLHKLKERIRTIALGGTAIGTCFFAPQKYVFLAEVKLRQITGLPLSRSQNLPDEISNQDKLSELAMGYNLFAQNIFKITNDLLLYTSSFIGELQHPNYQYGSTIMPAKTNPIILEYCKGLAIDIQGEVTKIINYTQNGQLQLNPFLPFITECFINIHTNIINMINRLLEHFISNFTINTDAIAKNLAGSSALLNILIPKLGYNKIKELYNKLQINQKDSKAITTTTQLKQFIAHNTPLAMDQLDKLFHPITATTFLKEPGND